MVKQLESLAATPKPMVIKSLELSDIPFLVDAFQKANWPKPASLFEARADINVIIKKADEIIAGICSEVYTWKILH